jgi:glycosyltransferase involved in cell wall biosynthesis
MKVLMIAPTPFFSDRGCHVRIYEEAKGIERLGHKVIICTYHLGRDIGGLKIERIKRIPWYKRIEAGPSIHKFYLDLLLLLKVLWVGRRFKPDLIHAHLHEGALLGLLAKAYLKVPIIFDYQGSLVAESIEHNFIKGGGILSKILSIIETKIERASSFIMISSMAGLKILKQKNLSNIHLIEDAADTLAFLQKQGDDLELVDRLGLPQGKKVIVYLGYLHPYEGIDFLFMSFKELIQRRSDIHFLIMGYPNVKEYKELASRLKISSFVTFTGRIPYEESPRYLRLGDVAVSGKMSQSEGNQKLCNYLSCGIPCVCFDTPVNRYILGEAGFYAPPGDVRTFAEKIIELIASEEKRFHIGKIARKRAEEKFSWEKRVEEIVKIYKSVVKEKG